VIPDWYAWTLVVVVALTIPAGIAAWLLWPRRSERLPVEHVAAAALVAVAAWEMLIDLPGSLVQFFAIGAGIPNAPFVPMQAFTFASAGFVVASAAAIFGILRRFVWGAALGIVVSVARVTMGALGVASLLTVAGDGLMPDGQLGWLVLTTGLRAVPALVAIVLLVLPFWRARRARQSAPVEEIMELDPDARVDEAELIVQAP
jgi:signal transduction histidine kinase